MNTISNNLSNAEIAVMVLAKAIEDGDMPLAICLDLYLKDPSIDTEKISFDEWLTEDKLADISVFLPDEWMEDTDFHPNEDPGPTKGHDFTSELQKWNLENEEVCRFILEEAEKVGTLEVCPRCGGRPSRMGQRRYAKVKICRSCRRDESRLVAQDKMLAFTGWHFIGFFKELQKKTA